MVHCILIRDRHGPELNLISHTCDHPASCVNYVGNLIVKVQRERFRPDKQDLTPRHNDAIPYANNVIGLQTLAVQDKLAGEPLHLLIGP